MIDVMEALCHQASQVAARVPYSQAQPRTWWEQLRLLEKAAAAILLAPGLKIHAGRSGELVLQLPRSSEGVGAAGCREDAHAVQQGC